MEPTIFQNTMNSQKGNSTLSGNYSIREMTAEEINSIAIEWAAREGWNPGLHDGKAFYETDPSGFYVGMLEDEPVACISVVKYPDEFAFLGFYIVRPEYRGKGFGLKIWNHAMSDVEGYNVGLDGVVESQEDYKKSGFSLAYNNIRYEGASQQFDIEGEDIVPTEQVSFDKIHEYDSRFFPVPRKVFLQKWVNLDDSYSYVAKKDETIAGYTSLRKCREGYKFGPLFAENTTIAEKLFLTAQNQVPPESKIFLDVPEANNYGIQLTQKHDMHKIFETARMYTGKEPDLDLNKIFGVTTFELG